MASTLAGRQGTVAPPGAPVRRRKALAAVAAATAAGAWGGAAGLATGTLNLGAQVTGRLPFASPVFGAAALTAIVAVPFTVLATLAWKADRRAALAAVAAGALLVGWIAVELAFIRSVSFLQPFYLLVGASFVLVGRREVRRRLRPLARSR